MLCSIFERSTRFATSLKSLGLFYSKRLFSRPEGECRPEEGRATKWPGRRGVRVAIAGCCLTLIPLLTLSAEIVTTKITATTARFGNMSSNVVKGNLQGNLVGNLVGNVRGNVFGNLSGNLSGNVTGRVNGTYVITSFTNLSTAKVVIGSTKATLEISTDQNVNNLTIPSTLTIKPINGAIITIASGKTLTINGHLIGPGVQCFAGNGLVTGLKEARPEWFGVKGDGATDDTIAIQKTIDSIGNQGGTIHFQSGTHIVTAGASETALQSYSAAVVIKNKSGLIISGSGDNTIFKAGTGGAGAPNFALFRIESSNNIEIKNIKLDGDCLANHSGDAGSRSGGIYITSFDVDTNADIAETNGVWLHHITAVDLGGFLKILRRTETTYALQPLVRNVTVENCNGTDVAQFDNALGFNYTAGIKVSHNKFTNTAVEDPYPSMFCDVSRGCEDAEVSYNTASNFVFGVKSEATVITVLGVDENRYAKNVSFVNNNLLQIGHPTAKTVGVGAAAGDTYAIKLNGINVSAINNTITGISGGFTTVAGGLVSGIYLLNSVDLDSVQTARGNTISAVDYGILMGNVVSATSTKTNQFVSNNIINDALIDGIIPQARALVSGNSIYRAARYAINVQISDNTRVHNNTAVDCGVSATGYVYYQSTSAADTVYFEYLDNIIIDTRGVNAAAYGYVFVAGTDYTKQYLVRPGYTTGLLTATLGADYVNAFLDSRGTSVKASGTISGTTVTNGFNIASATAVDATVTEIAFRRALPNNTYKYTITSTTGGKFFIPYGATTTTARVRCVDSAGTPVATTGFHITIN